MPSATLAGVVETFAAQTAPDDSSKTTTSVKVPPMSTARRSRGKGLTAFPVRAQIDVGAIDLSQRPRG